MRLVRCAILIVLAALPNRAFAAVTISNAGGVEIIVAQPDPPIAFRRPNRSLDRSAPTARTLATRALAAPSLAGGSAIVRTALSLVGAPYVWGGTSPHGFDCSGFTYYTFAQMGIRIPRTADAQFAEGRIVNGAPAPGDLVFFQTYDYGASHVGMYIGKGRFVNSIGSDVHIATFASPYFRGRYIGARRFLPG